MPLLIRIIVQRVAVVFLSFLAFLGINPDIDIPTDEEIRALEQEQREIVQEVLSPSLEEGRASEKLKEIEEEVEEIVKQVTERQTQTQEVVEKIINIPTVTTTDTGIILQGDEIDNIIVNIVCVNRSGGVIRMSTGSGVIVSSSGLVLTNSHVANTFLFDDEDSVNYKECSLRRENIPTYGFNAELVYLPRDWLRENQSFFTDDQPKGSGENDYALLAITSNTNPALSVPSSFNYAKVLTDEGSIDEEIPIVVAAYPGTHTGIFEIDSNVKLKKVNSSVQELVTFNGTTIDIVSTEPNIVAQRGSSGGGVFWNDKLLGLITTTDSIGSNSFLNAITLPYIIRDFKNDTGDSFISFIRRDKSGLISDFKKEEDELKSLIAEFL
jgi:hypothetical protein